MSKPPKRSSLKDTGSDLVVEEIVVESGEDISDTNVALSVVSGGGYTRGGLNNDTSEFNRKSKRGYDDEEKSSSGFSNFNRWGLGQISRVMPGETPRADIERDETPGSGVNEDYGYKSEGNLIRFLFNLKKYLFTN